MGVVRRSAWLAFLLFGVLMAVAVVRVDSLEVKTALLLTLHAASFAAVTTAVRLHRPQPGAAWWLIAATVGLWFVAWIFWQGYILTHDGVTPALDSWQNIYSLVIFYPPLIAACIYKLRRLDTGIGPLVETAILCAALTMVTWSVLIVRYIENTEMSPAAKVVQSAFALGDVVLVAVLLRIAVGEVRRNPAFLLFLLSVAAYLSSNALWIWAAELGHYVPGSWADLGWLLFPALSATAALHPAMRTVCGAQKSAASPVAWSNVVLLLGATLLGPTILGIHAVRDEEIGRELYLVGATGAVGVFVLVRLVVNLRERQVLGAHLEKQNLELKELDRLKDDFVASVSHELRTPLTSIRGYLELVRDREVGELTEQQDAFLEIIDRNSERLLRVVGDLLFVAQLDAAGFPIERGSIDLGAVVRQACEAALPVAQERGIDLATELGQLPASLTGDATRLAQALDNVISNALKFTPRGGVITLRASNGDGHVDISVSDTGPGISAHDQRRLFQRFFRTESANDQAVPGTGLGLAITKAIIEAHDGTISVVSALGAGTEFHILLPVR